MSVQHQLNLSIFTPEVVTYGKEFEITYILRNKGPTIFPGGVVVVELSWPSVNEKVNQPIEIKKQLKPDEASDPVTMT